MSRKGNVFDNAAMESWNSTLKTELGERFETHAEAKDELFDFIEVFYNQQRRHSALGYLSPAPLWEPPGKRPMTRGLGTAMYTSEARFKRDRALFLSVWLLGGALPMGTIVTGDIAWGYGAPWVAVALMIASVRVLMRCARCQKSVLWWAFTHARSADFWRVATTTRACPYCGFDGPGNRTLG